MCLWQQTRLGHCWHIRCKWGWETGPDEAWGKLNKCTVSLLMQCPFWGGQYGQNMISHTKCIKNFMSVLILNVLWLYVTNRCDCQCSNDYYPSVPVKIILGTVDIWYFNLRKPLKFITRLQVSNRIILGMRERLPFTSKAGASDSTSWAARTGRGSSSASSSRGPPLTRAKGKLRSWPTYFTSGETLAEEN